MFSSTNTEGSNVEPEVEYLGSSRIASTSSAIPKHSDRSHEIGINSKVFRWLGYLGRSKRKELADAYVVLG